MRFELLYVAALSNDESYYSWFFCIKIIVLKKNSELTQERLCKGFILYCIYIVYYLWREFTKSIYFHWAVICFLFNSSCRIIFQLFYNIP